MASKTRKSVPNATGATGSPYTTKQLRDGARMLKTGKLTQREIAAKCGVKSPAYFALVVREVAAA